MPKFNVVAIFDCTVNLGEIEADTPEQAKEKAHEKIDKDPEWGNKVYPTLCHQCAREVDLGDMVDVAVFPDN